MSDTAEPPHNPPRPLAPSPAAPPTDRELVGSAAAPLVLGQMASSIPQTVDPRTGTQRFGTQRFGAQRFGTQRFGDRFARRGSLGSAVLHGVAIAGLAIGQPWLDWLWGPPLAKPRSLQIVAQGPWRGPVSDDPVLEYALEVDQARDQARGENHAAKRSPSQTTESVKATPEGQSPKPQPAADSAFVPETIVRRRVERAIEEADEVGTEENLKRLDRLSGQLEKVATDQSVAELNEKLKRWLGTKPRATEPAKEPVAGPFDIATAQVHDVRREGDDKTMYRYVAVLLDAEGRQMDQELGIEEGEQLYRTFQLIKKNPLLEKVYRQVVMGLLDKLTQPTQ